MSPVRKNFPSPISCTDYARTVFVRLGHILLILALLGATGGHWAVLQTIAWADMLAKNLQTESVGTALTKTFDGQHPCKMCKQISAGKQAEKQSELPLQIKKLEFVSERPAFVFIAPQEFRLAPIFLPELDGLTHRPSVPPPRSSRCLIPRRFVVP
jgi:hypothetical protein